MNSSARIWFYVFSIGGYRASGSSLAKPLPKGSLSTPIALLGTRRSCWVRVYKLSTRPSVAKTTPQRVGSVGMAGGEKKAPADEFFVDEDEVRWGKDSCLFTSPI